MLKAIQVPKAPVRNCFTRSDDEMLSLPATHNQSLHQPFFPILQTCRSEEDVKRAHALSLRTGAFDHPTISGRLLSLYAAPAVNHLAYARSLFALLPHPDLVSWNVLLKCFVHNHRSHDSLALFRHLLRHFLPDSFTLPTVLKGCARLSALREGRQIHAMAFKLACASDKFVQSSLVSMYSRCGDVACARKVFDQMPDWARDLVLWNSLIDAYARCGDPELALELFDEMPEKDSFSWTCLVDGFSKSGMLEMARDVFDRMPTRTQVSWNAMINGYMKSGEFKTARRLFYEMPARDVITWNSMIAGYESNGKFTEAIYMFTSMLKEGLMPNDTTLVGALSAVSGLAVLGAGKWIHSLMVKAGVESEGVLGTSLIDMYSKCGSVESALQVFELVSRKKLGHWTAVIVGLGMHGMADQALELFSEMRSAALQPHAIAFLGVLNACSHAGLVDPGRQHFNTMRHEFGIEPTIEHYGCLVDMLCRAGNLEEAKGVIESMPMRPNKVIWMSLLSGSRNHGNLAIGEYAAQRLIEVAPETIGCYVVLSNMYATAGKWDKVASVRETMRKRGIRKEPGCSYIEHKGTLHEFIVGDKSHPRAQEIYSKIGEMREKLRSAGHVPDTSQVLLCLEDEKEKEAELEKHSERLAIAFGLINGESRGPIRVIKNLRVCNDCHAVTKLLSEIYDREIIVRDNSRFHHFRNGLCSCKDFW